MDRDIDDEALPSLYRPSTILPISRHKRALLYTIETTPITILIGETGSGKTTQLPQYLDEAGWTSNGKMIACTQPRRVAATTVAMRVAEEMGVRLGEEVGYLIRFEDLTSPRTRIKYMTDGMLLREILVDPLLTKYSVVMVDEAHERSISTDLLLGVLKKIRRKRKDLRIVISSATLQAEEFLHFFTCSEEDENEIQTLEKGQELARIVSVEGKVFPVDILYLESPAEDYVEKAVETVYEIHLKEGPGDILVFLTGRSEIDNAIEKISTLTSQIPSRSPQLLPLPLYAGLTTEQQLYVFEPAPENHRKVILSTPISEASVTVPGITFIIDTGFHKIRSYNPYTCISSLTTTPISRASATQRAGRAGRTKPGKCFRLYPESAFHSLPASTIPELQRSDLAPVILQLKALGVDNVARFHFPSAPPPELVARALELLYTLGALDSYGKLTRPFGLRLAELPLPPPLAAIVLSSIDYNCHQQILSIAAMTSISSSIFVDHADTTKLTASKKRNFTADEGDHLTLLNVFLAFSSQPEKKKARWCHDNVLNYQSLLRAASIRAQLARFLERWYPDLNSRTSSLVTETTIRKCLVKGLFPFAAKMQPDGSFRLAGDTRSANGNQEEGQEKVYVHPSSVLFNRKAEWVVFQQLEEARGKRYIRDVTKVQREWVVEAGGGYYTVGEKKR